MLELSQKKAWGYLRDEWEKLQAESPPPPNAKVIGDRPSFEGVIARGGPRAYVEKWANDKARWQDYGIPWKFVTSYPAQKALFGLKENWELAAIDDLEATDLDILLNELQGVLNGIKAKEGEPQDAPRFVAPVSYGGPTVKAAEGLMAVSPDVLKAPGSGPGAPKAGQDLGELLKYLTPTNLAIAAAVTAGVVVLGPALGSTLGAYASSRARAKG